MIKDAIISANASNALSDFHHHHTALDGFLIVAFIVIFVTGIIGNALVLYVFKFDNSKPLNTMECFICYLALDDLLASIINPLMFTYWTLTGHSVWHFGSIGCIILPGLTRITVSFSFGMILIITIDRCHVICQPFKPHLKPHLTWIPALIVLFLSILSEIPKMVYVNTTNDGHCDVNIHQSSKSYIYPRVIILIGRDVIFLIIFSFTLCSIYKELYQKERLLTLREQANHKKMKNIVVMLVAMAVIFVVLVFPREIFVIVFETSYFSPHGIKETPSIQDVNSVLKMFHMGNSVCNPFIYAKLHTQFHRNLSNMMKRFFNEVNRKTMHQHEISNDNYCFIQKIQGLKEEYGGTAPLFALTRYQDRIGKRSTQYRHTTYDFVTQL